jgi:hypothetical protein
MLLRDRLESRMISGLKNKAQGKPRVHVRDRIPAALREDKPKVKFRA